MCNLENNIVKNNPIVMATFKKLRVNNLPNILSRSSSTRLSTSHQTTTTTLTTTTTMTTITTTTTWTWTQTLEREREERGTLQKPLKPKRGAKKLNLLYKVWVYFYQEKCDFVYLLVYFKLGQIYRVCILKWIKTIEKELIQIIKQNQTQQINSLPPKVK